MDTLGSFFDKSPASTMKNELDAEYSRSSEGSGPAIRSPRQGKGKTPERTQRSGERHPHNSNPFVTCSGEGGRSRPPRHEPTGCKVGAAGVVGGGGDDTPLSSGGERPPPAYCGRESTPCRPLPRSELHWGDMDMDEDIEFGPDAGPSSSGGPRDGGPPRRPGREPPGGPPGGGQPREPPSGVPPDRGPPGGPPGGDPPQDPPGADIPEDIWPWIVYHKRKIWSLER